MLSFFKKSGKKNLEVEIKYDAKVSGKVFLGIEFVADKPAEKKIKDKLIDLQSYHGVTLKFIKASFPADEETEKKVLF